MLTSLLQYKCYLLFQHHPPVLQRDGSGAGADPAGPAPLLAREEVKCEYKHNEHKYRHQTLRTLTLGTEQFNALQLWPRISPWYSGNETINLDIESCLQWDRGPH